MRVPVIASCLGVLCGLLVAAGVGSPASAGPGADDGPPALRSLPLATGDGLPAATAGVTRRRATLTVDDRAAGYPTEPAAHLRLVSAELSLDLEDDEFFGNATLAAAPPSDQRPVVTYAVGRAERRTCNLHADQLHDYFSGTATTYAAEDLPPSWERADCAAAILTFDGTPVDVLVGSLADELPRLRLGAPTLLGSRKLRLVRGVWTRLDVPVTNRGPAEAFGVVVSGTGKGVKVRPGRLGYPLGVGTAGTASIRVKLVGPQRKSTLRLVVRSGAARSGRPAVVRRVPAPPPPRPGRYRSRDAEVTLRISRGRPKVTEFSVRAQTTCGVYPDPPTTTWVTYDFPSTAIARNGIVDRRVHQERYAVTLQLKAVGGKVTRGRFAYSGPGGCSAVESFTARLDRR
jgi:hypothetical protein